MRIVSRAIVALFSIVVGDPLTGAETDAVGQALSQALGVLSGKVKSGDKFSICSNMFPDGAPADAQDASWQACRDELPSQHAYKSLLAWKRAVVARGGAQTPLTSAEKTAVGQALSSALGVLSGKVKSGDKYSICSGMFPMGAPSNAATDASWQACKGVLGSSFLSKKKSISKVSEPLTAAEKEAVGTALTNALGVMSGKVKSGDKFSICSNMFPEGAPADSADASWQACRDVLPSMSTHGGSLLSWKKAVVAAGGAKNPLTQREREAVGAALSNAIGVLSGKVKSGSRWEICSQMFPNGTPSNQAEPSWQACKGVLG